MDRLLEQLQQLEADNRSLREDLGFFEKLTPTGKPGNLTIRGLNAETLVGGGQLNWQVLAIQALPAMRRNSKGRLELVLAGTLNGRLGRTAFQPDHGRRFSSASTGGLGAYRPCRRTPW